MKLIWDEDAWDDYFWWQTQDRKILKRINTLLSDVLRDGNEGIGKPEPLKQGFHGYWSRRTTDEHRLIYKVESDEVRIAGCRYHYGRREGVATRTLTENVAAADLSGLQRRGSATRGPGPPRPGGA